MRPTARLALPFALLLLGTAAPSRAQWFWGASPDAGALASHPGYSAIWAYPTDLSNGPSPYYSPVFNAMAASRPAPSLEPSPFARSPLDLLRFNRPGSDRTRHRLFHRR